MFLTIIFFGGEVCICVLCFCMCVIALVLMNVWLLVYVMCYICLYKKGREKESYLERIPFIVSHKQRQSAKTVRNYEKLELFINLCNLRLQIYFQYQNCAFLSLSYNTIARFFKN